MCLGMGFWNLFAGHSKIAFFWPILPESTQRAFFAKFQVKISQRVIPVQKRPRYVKSFKIFQLSENVTKKGFSHPEGTQNHKWQNSKFSKSQNFVCCHLWFWVSSGCEKPFLAAFSESWKNSKDFTYLDRFCTGITRWNILTWNLAKKCPLGQLVQNMPKNAIFECPANKSQKPIPKQMVQDRYYHRLIA